MIEFTFMGRRYVVMVQRAETVEQGDGMPATQADLEAAGYQPFTRRADQPAATETAPKPLPGYQHLAGPAGGPGFEPRAEHVFHTEGAGSYCDNCGLNWCVRDVILCRHGKEVVK